MKKTLLLFTLCTQINAQVSLDFEEDLCSGSNKCVTGYIPATPTKLKAEPSLCGNFNYTQNTTNPISGAGSLHFENEIIAPSYVFLTQSIISTIAFGADGDTYSFNIRFNNIHQYYTSPPLRVDVYCGNYHAFTEYSLADIGQIKNISGTINNSLGGGTIRILFSNFSGFIQTNGIFSYDFDDFTSTAKLDIENNACLKETLPLTLLGFTIKNIENSTVLNWHTENETNFSHFEIEKSINGLQFNEIGRVHTNTENGNYQFIDEAPKRSIIYYRLKMIDLDGSFTYSKIVASQNILPNNTTKAFPNPVKNGVFKIIEQNRIIDYSFFDSIGNKKPLIMNKTQMGYQFEMFKKEKTGIYFLQITTLLQGIKTFKIMVE
jgi:hypothetical protein